MKTYKIQQEEMLFTVYPLVFHHLIPSAHDIFPQVMCIRWPPLRAPALSHLLDAFDQVSYAMIESHSNDIVHNNRLSS